MYRRNPAVSTWGTTFEKPLAVPSGTAPMTRSTTPAGDPAPGARAAPRVAFEARVAFALALAPWTAGQASPVGFAPPARPGQGQPPEAGCIFREQHALTLARPICEGS